jgi:hypothetical protein
MSDIFADAMNYHRRTTRPDATFYRDQRKVPRSGRGGRGGQGVSPIAIVIALAVLATAAFFMLRH